MRNVNASDARKHWFRLLDEALNGEVIIVQRKGRRLILRREESNKNRKTLESPQYKNLLRVPNADHADRWTWEWGDSRKGLIARRRKAS